MRDTTRRGHREALGGDCRKSEGPHEWWATAASTVGGLPATVEVRCARCGERREVTMDEVRLEAVTRTELVGYRALEAEGAVAREHDT